MKISGDTAPYIMVLRPYDALSVKNVQYLYCFTESPTIISSWSGVSFDVDWYGFGARVAPKRLACKDGVLLVEISERSATSSIFKLCY